MILSRFLKPKWQHTDSATRQKALRELDQADPKLIELARQDLEPSVRRAALERLVDLDVLLTMEGSIWLVLLLATMAATAAGMVLRLLFEVSRALYRVVRAKSDVGQTGID